MVEMAKRKALKQATQRVEAGATHPHPESLRRVRATRLYLYER
jgi:hypothetical protein